LKPLSLLGSKPPVNQHFFQQRFFNTSALKAALESNRQRSGKALISEKGIIGAYRKLELPSFDEGFDRLFYVEIVEDGQFIVKE